MTHSQNQVAIVANGLIRDHALIAERIKAYSRVIAADGGAEHCLKMGIEPEVIIGDLDSTSEETVKKFPKANLRRYPKDKDETDLELAIQAACTPDVSKVTLFGATGLRLDHTLVNLHFLCRHPDKLYIETENEIIFAIHQAQTVNCFPGQIISLIPLIEPASGVTSKGLKWELANATMDANFLSISNVCLGSSFQISIKSGILLCCMNIS